MNIYASNPGPDIEALALLAREDLARELKLDAGQIRLISIEPVTWPDSSLGCPQPGMLYAQVLTPGYLILLDVQHRLYEYHTGRGGGSLVRCQDPQPPLPGGSRDI